MQVNSDDLDFIVSPRSVHPLPATTAPAATSSTTAAAETGGASRTARPRIPSAHPATCSAERAAVSSAWSIRHRAVADAVSGSARSAKVAAVTGARAVGRITRARPAAIAEAALLPVADSTAVADSTLLAVADSTAITAQARVLSLTRIRLPVG